MFTVFYHPKVRDDVRRIDTAHLAVIRRAINEKIAGRLEHYGKPLRRTLKNLRSLRIGDYRIVYSVQSGKLIVLIIIIGKRDSVYREAGKRI